MGKLMAGFHRCPISGEIETPYRSGNHGSIFPFWGFLTPKQPVGPMPKRIILTKLVQQSIPFVGCFPATANFETTAPVRLAVNPDQSAVYKPIVVELIPADVEAGTTYPIQGSIVLDPLQLHSLFGISDIKAFVVVGRTRKYGKIIKIQAP